MRDRRRDQELAAGLPGTVIQSVWLLLSAEAHFFVRYR